jgi:RNA polymerase sigma factor (sigma-70 family)
MELDALVRRTVTNEHGAFRELMERITPEIHKIARGHQAMRSRGLADSSDELSAVTLATLERLARDDYANLRRYLAQRELTHPQSFDSWLYGAVDFTIRDHLRSRFGRAPKEAVLGVRSLPSKRELHSQASQLDEEALRLSITQSLGITSALSLAEILAYVFAKFDEHEVRALQLHYAEDKSPADIALALGLPDEVSAQKLLRRLIARLRHRFAGPSERGE